MKKHFYVYKLLMLLTAAFLVVAKSDLPGKGDEFNTYTYFWCFQKNN